MRVEWRLRRAAGVLIALSGLCGCAHSYIDADGNRNVIGFVHLTLPPSDKEPRAADWMRVRAIGLALSRTEIGGALELGYSDNTLAAVRNNSCVQLPQPPATLPLKGVVNAASLDF